MDQTPPLSTTTSHTFGSVSNSSSLTNDTNHRQDEILPISPSSKAIKQRWVKNNSTIQPPITNYALQHLKNMNSHDCQTNQTWDKGNNIKPKLKHEAPNLKAPCKKKRRSNGTESDHTDTDYELESAVRHALKKNKDGLNFEELGAPSIVALLSPSVREVLKNVELVRLPLVGIGLRNTRSKSIDTDGRRELWPGVASCGAAVQCIHCRESGRHVLSSLLTLWQHLGILAYNHFAHCQTIPDDKGATLQNLTPKFNSTSFKLFQTELGVFCQHVAENLQRDSQISSGVPVTQNYCHGGNSKQGSRVMDLEEVLYRNGKNGKFTVTRKPILKSVSRNYEQIPRHKNPGETKLNLLTAPKTIVSKLQDKMSLQASEDLELKKAACSGKCRYKDKDKSLVSDLKRLRCIENVGYKQYVMEEISET